MIKSLEAQGLQLAKEKQEYLGWLEGWTVSKTAQTVFSLTLPFSGVLSSH